MSQHNCLEEFNARIIERKQNFLNDPHFIILFDETKEIRNLGLNIQSKGETPILEYKMSLDNKVGENQEEISMHSSSRAAVSE